MRMTARELRQETFRALRAGADAVQRNVRGALAAFELTPSRFGVLEALYHHGSSSQRELAEAIGRTPGDLSMVLANLERDGLVERERSEVDRRVYRSTLTAEGMTIAARSLARLDEVLTEAFEDFDEDELQALAFHCGRLTGEARQVEAPGTCEPEDRILRNSEREYSDFGRFQRYAMAGIPVSKSCEKSSGRLHLFADDVLQEGQVIPARALEDMEAVYIILSGELSFEQGGSKWRSAGECEVVGLSAGTGTNWAEFNPGPGNLRLLRLEFEPTVYGLEPACHVACFSPAQRRNRLLPVASGTGDRDALRINLPAVVGLASLDPARTLHLGTEDGDTAVIHVLEGKVRVGRHMLEAGDSLSTPLPVAGVGIAAEEAAELVVVTMNE